MGTDTSMAKGQILSTDLVVSLSLFLAALLVFTLAWRSMSQGYWEAQSDMDMQSAALSISDALALSQGYPQGWEFSQQGNATSFGLASSKNALSHAKIKALQSSFASDYYSAKGTLGAGRFEPYITVGYASGATLYSFGQAPSSQNMSVSSAIAERLCLLDGKLALLRVQLWRVKGGAL